MASAKRIGSAAHALLAAALGGGEAEASPLPLLDGERDEAERLARRFLDSELGRRARAAREMLIEEPLTVALPPDQVLDGFLDLAFREEEGWVLVDYKSDRVAAGEAAAHAGRYRSQLALYAHAVERLTGRPVGEAHLFFLALGTSVRYTRSELAETLESTAAGASNAARTISSVGSSVT